MPEANRNPLLEFLNECNLDNVGHKRLNWIETAEDFSPVKLAEMIRKGIESLESARWDVTPSVASALVKLPLSKILEIEELELPDTITIELNVAHEGSVNYRPLNMLSTGQQCTAILHMLLWITRPLIMDQPEDNLDNDLSQTACNELRSQKYQGNFVATHNANIPVFGDAEWIGVFESKESHAYIAEDAQVLLITAGSTEGGEILEGGRMAFIQRKEKYGF